jgi:hypothetical protein
MSRPSDFVQGTLDLVLLKIPALQPLHGWASIRQCCFTLNNLYPPGALDRLIVDCLPSQHLEGRASSIGRLADEMVAAVEETGHRP